jgi:fructokinase
MSRVVQGAPTGKVRLGIDLGGTKIEGVALGPADVELSRHRRPTPRDDYGGTIETIASIITALEVDTGERGSIGVGMPGSLSPKTRLVQNANSTWLNARPFDRDVESRLGRPVRFANDANCFALSEAADGAAVGASTVFGVILGTGCGGGLVHKGSIIDGPRGIGGEWGHNPLPWADLREHPGPSCWCGRMGCMETWVSGPALSADHARATGESHTVEEIARRAELGKEVAAQATLDRHASRLARGLAAMINTFDPDVIVLGGGLSRLAHLYTQLPTLIRPHVFADDAAVIIHPPRWGDASGARGAARLWDR